MARLILYIVFLLNIYYTTAVPWDEETALDAYVNLDDGYFNWEITGEVRYDREEVTVYTLNMTSQKWQDESFVDHPIWWHQMGIAVPDQIDFPNAAYIWVGEQSNDWGDPEPEGNFSLYNMAISMLANNTRCIGAYVLQIPNQRLKFTNHPEPDRGLSEDTLIAWSWRSFLDSEPSDPTLALRMPMTKAAKRAVDAIQEFGQSELGINIDSFLPLGASKRGWTVWSLAAVDQRVKVMVPIVFSLLNMPVSMMNHFRALDGQWTFAFEPYWEVNLTAEFNAPKTQELFAIEDMYIYRERLTIPKVMIVATGDEFFSCTDSHAWWDDMPEPKYVFFVENTEHILFPEYREVFETVTGVFLTYLNGQPLPSLTWTRTEFAGGSSIEAWADPAPVEWRAMRAQTLRNDTRRDFRLFAGYPEPAFHPVLWFNSSYEERGDGHYYVEFDNVEDEWVGFFMFGYWNGPKNNRIFLSTEIQVTPDTFPAPVCEQDPDCYGNLI